MAEDSFQNRPGQTVPWGEQWSANTDLVFRDGKPLQLLAQSCLIQDVLRRSIEFATATIALNEDAFPSDSNRIKLSRKAVCDAALDLGKMEVSRRLNFDSKYLGDLAKIVSKTTCGYNPLTISIA